VILETPRGVNGFGYDPLFYFPAIGKTFSELNSEEKSKYSHRGKAFRVFLDWHENVWHENVASKQMRNPASK